MNIMRPLFAVFVGVSLSLTAVRAQDKGAAPAPQGAETYEAVKKQYTDAVRTWSKEYRAAIEEAKKNGKDEPFHFDKPRPDAKLRRVSWRSRNGIPRDQMRSKPSTSRSGPATPPGSSAHLKLGTEP